METYESPKVETADVQLIEMFAGHYAIVDANPDDAGYVAEDWHATASFAREHGYNAEQIAQLAESGRQLYQNKIQS